MELRQVTDIATVFQAFVPLNMLLKLVDGHPFTRTVKITFNASMRELTEFHHVANDRVDFGQEISFGTAVGAGHPVKSQLVIDQLLLLLIALSAQALLPLIGCLP